jgi:hypothetical protein
MHTAPFAAAERAAAWYRDSCLWPARAAGEHVLLPLGHGIVAFDVASERAVHVQRALVRNGMTPPALLVKKPETRIIFLAEADDSVFGQCQMPTGVLYLSVRVDLRLPLLNKLSPDDAGWFHGPDPAHRWLPSAASVLAVINSVTPFALRAYRPPARAPRRDRVLIG